MSRWPMVPLREVLKLDLDKVLVDTATEYPMVGVLSFARGLFNRETITNGQTSYRVFYRLKAQHVVMSQLFGWEGALALSSGEFSGKFLSPQFPTFLCDSKKLDRSFLGWLFKRPAFWKELGAHASGMGDRRRTLNPEALFSCRIPLPPLAEQQRLVERIGALASKIEEAKAHRKKSHLEAEAIIKAARNRLIGDSPTSAWVPLRMFVQHIENGWSPSCEKRAAAEGEWAVLKVGAVSFGQYDPRENKALPTNLAPKPEYEVKAGNFLMSRANTFDLVGACAFVEMTPPRLMLSDKLFRFIVKRDKAINLQFLDHVLKSPALRTQIIAGATGTSPTMKNISKEKVLKLLVPNFNLPEQQRLAGRLESLQQKTRILSEVQQATERELNAMVPAILDQAFQGKL